MLHYGVGMGHCAEGWGWITILHVCWGVGLDYYTIGRLIRVRLDHYG